MRIHATAFADVITASTDDMPGLWDVEVCGLAPHDVVMKFEVMTYHEKDACEMGIERFIAQFIFHRGLSVDVMGGTRRCP